ncbi:MAG TPA: LytTR family DNA-binding domain-containing protein, partial [Prolixibacteraceae bacterium]|nr:LytTR family DNA-binding domain-containing protein [Prolixibacteraceae bacterium]
QYALKAFEFNAADYLLKPFSKDRLLAAVDKVTERLAKKVESDDMVDKISNFSREEFLDRVVVKDRHKIHIIPVDQIRYVESLDDYVLIYTNEGRFMKQKTMKYFETALDPRNFARIHRSYIVRIDQIAQLQQYEKESYIVILHDKTKLKVSKTGYKNLKEMLNF